ncbi:hypothetical protein TEA_002352 [Camellia sinensis var. sinensis]|uniref:Uncharacterized protein n=1 Tax=Camellia sinensis var. sinensis TaxID=542762 RepID=A0A4S4EK21_CAMSN|nr:hypothetical protein TEA_002352 [Camellia sinensis var. sinensis]
MHAKQGISARTGWSGHVRAHVPFMQSQSFVLGKQAARAGLPAARAVLGKKDLFENSATLKLNRYQQRPSSLVLIAIAGGGFIWPPSLPVLISVVGVELLLCLVSSSHHRSLAECFIRTPPSPVLIFIECLNGEFVRVGPNPKFTPVAGYHCMIHGLRIKDGKATYVSRYVRTSRLKQEEFFGGSKFMKEVLYVIANCFKAYLDPSLFFASFSFILQYIGVYLSEPLNLNQSPLRILVALQMDYPTMPSSHSSCGGNTKPKWFSCQGFGHDA